MALALVSVSALPFARPARAQLLDAFFPRDLPGYDTAPGVTVTSRTRPGYEERNFRAGSFVVRPQVAESFGYNDNLLGQRHGPGSAFARTDASIQAVSDWSRHSLGAFVATDDRRYFDRADQNETNWQGSLGGTYDIGRDQASLTYRHLSQHQDPTDLDSVDFDRPLAYRVEDARAAYRIAFSRFSLTPAVEFLSYRFSNGSRLGQPVIENGRDRDVLQEEVTARYEVTPQTVVVGLVRPVQVHYVRSVNGVRQPNSQGVSVLGGLDYLGQGPWRYRLLGGYQTREYSSGFKSHSAPIVEANVTWNPTGLTTVTGSATRTIEDASSEDTIGYTFSQAQLAVDHEYRRNVLLRGYLGLQNADYLQGGRVQTIYQTGVGVTWLLNRSMRLVATYDFRHSHSTGSFSPVTGLVSSTGSNTYSRDLYLLRLEFGRFDPQ